MEMKNIHGRERARFWIITFKTLHCVLFAPTNFSLYFEEAWDKNKKDDF